MPKIPDVPAMGKNIVQLRKRINLSIDGLAKICGVSKAMISQIEQEKVNPTVATIWKIAKGLGVEFDTLFGTQKNLRHFAVSRSESLQTIKNMDNECEVKILTPPQMVDELEMYWLTFKAQGALISEPHFSFTQEIATVIKGSAEITAAENSIVLHKGDSLRYHADVKHSIREAGNQESEVILAVYFKEPKKQGL
ncbi:MAG: helix-turn-helix domain-containing protein [bacterium]